MKVFLFMWMGLCFLVIVVLFIAYATDGFPGVVASQQVELQVAEDCSPCEDNLKLLTQAMERSKGGRKVSVKTENTADLKTAFEEFQKAFETYDRNKNAHNKANIKQEFEQLQMVLELSKENRNAKAAAGAASDTK